MKSEGNGGRWILWIEIRHGISGYHGTAEDQQRLGSNSRALGQSSYSPGKATRAWVLRSTPGEALGFCELNMELPAISEIESSSPIYGTALEREQRALRLANKLAGKVTAIQNLQGTLDWYHD